MDKIKKIMRGLVTSLGKINKLTLSTTIIIASIILGGFYFGSQVNKQRSIERQQEIKIEQERQETETKAGQDKCKALSSGVKENWNNVMGVTYDDFWKECMVTFTDTKTGEIKVSPLKNMKDGPKKKIYTEIIKLKPLISKYDELPLLREYLKGNFIVGDYENILFKYPENAAKLIINYAELLNQINKVDIKNIKKDLKIIFNIVQKIKPAIK